MTTTIVTESGRRNLARREAERAVVEGERRQVAAAVALDMVTGEQREADRPAALEAAIRANLVLADAYVQVARLWPAESLVWHAACRAAAHLRAEAYLVDPLVTVRVGQELRARGGNWVTVR